MIDVNSDAAHAMTWIFGKKSSTVGCCTSAVVVVGVAAGCVALTGNPLLVSAGGTVVVVGWDVDTYIDGVDDWMTTEAAIGRPVMAEGVAAGSKGVDGREYVVVVILVVDEVDWGLARSVEPFGVDW